MFIISYRIPINYFFPFILYTDDHSRVILQSTENGDYINANFIKVCNTNTKFLSTKTEKIFLLSITCKFIKRIKAKIENIQFFLIPECRWRNSIHSVSR